MNQEKSIKSLPLLINKLKREKLARKLMMFFCLLSLSLCLASPARASSPLIRVRIMEGNESIGIGASGSYQIKDGKGRISTFPPSSLLQVMQATPGGIKINGVFWERKIWVKPQEDAFLILSSTKEGKRRYRGSFIVEQEGNSLGVIDELPLEEYLYGVLKWEISPDWSMDALCAQAVAARTFALKKIKEPLLEDQLHHLSDTVEDQVYGGLESEDIRATEAVNLTRGKVITYQEELINAFYHSCCGGYTISSKDLWGGETLPYLRVGPDRFCQDSPHYHWEWEVERSELRKILFEQGFPVGIMYRLQIVSRAENLSFEEGGRVTGLFWEHQRGKSPDKPLTGKEFRELINKWFGEDVLRSTLFDEVKLRVKEGKSYFLFRGRGSGHGVGMCQWGAKEMAEQGHSFEEILRFYYPGTTIEEHY